jgi:hypothetical protein
MYIWRTLVSMTDYSLIGREAQDRMDELEDSIDFPNREIGQDDKDYLGSILMTAHQAGMLTAGELNFLKRKLHLNKEVPTVHEAVA